MAYRYRRRVNAAIGYGEFVMPGLVPGIHAFKTLQQATRTWMAGTSPAMTGNATFVDEPVRKTFQL
jgi:hypothetical protein